MGVDAYYKHAAQLIDAGQFGAPIILTPFNYQTGRQTGAELTVNYAARRCRLTPIFHGSAPRAGA